MKLETMVGLVLMTAMDLPRISAQSPREFDVASIKIDLSRTSSSGTKTAHGRLTATNVSLKRLMQFALGVNDFQIVGGPGWLGTDKYDIDAKADVSGDIADADYGPMVQALLADRFKLKFHRETKELPVYSLVVAKNGPKLTEHHVEHDTEHDGDEGATTKTSHGPKKTNMVATKVSMAGFCERLGRETDRAVIDHTGLKGEYDLKLEWSPEQTADSAIPSLFTALQEQLGLRLTSTKGPVEVIVIDSVERPSEN